MDQPHLIKGNSHKDERGTLAYNNDFNLDKIKRFYTIEPSNNQDIRGWQGHKKEQNWFQVVNGSFLVLVVKPDNWENPSVDLKLEEYILRDDVNEILYIPGGYVTGLKSLEPNSKLLVFSDFTLEESKNGDFRFDKDRWYYETFM